MSCLACCSGVSGNAAPPLVDRVAETPAAASIQPYMGGGRDHLFTPANGPRIREGTESSFPVRVSCLVSRTGHSGVIDGPADAQEHARSAAEMRFQNVDVAALSSHPAEVVVRTVPGLSAFSERCR